MLAYNGILLGDGPFEVLALHCETVGGRQNVRHGSGWLLQSGRKNSGRFLKDRDKVVQGVVCIPESGGITLHKHQLEFDSLGPSARSGSDTGEKR